MSAAGSTALPPAIIPSAPTLERTEAGRADLFLPATALNRHSVLMDHNTLSKLEVSSPFKPSAG